MANRTFNAPRALEKEMIRLTLKIPLSAAAAVGTISGRGVVSVTKTNTGLYTVQLQDTYNRLLGFNAEVVASGAFVVFPQISSETVNTKTSEALPGGTLVLKTVNTAGANTDTAVAGTICLELVLSNSSIT